MSKKNSQINVFMRSPNGFETRKVNVLQNIQEGVVLVKNGPLYHVVDARTGMDISSAKTKKDALEYFDNHKGTYAKVKKEQRYSEYAILNKKDPQGNWKPQDVTFPNLVQIRSGKRKKGDKYGDPHTFLLPQHTEKSLQRTLRKQSVSNPGLPTIRKVYGSKKGEIVKIVEYRKGYTLDKISTFKPGKAPKGTKLISKRFIK